MRTSLFIIGLFAIIFTSPWIPLVCMAILAFRYPAWEVLFLGLLMDFLWLPTDYFHTFPLFTVVAFVLVWGLEPLRREFLFS